ncbi:MAG: CARDB domain-containing protein, partial [Candidatus Micrarchaeia archaeon]
PGGFVQVSGTYSNPSITGQITVTFTARGTATVCGVPNTPVSVTTCTVQVGQCPTASVDITGHIPTSITLSGNQAGLTVFVMNNGTANLSIASFSANNGFTFTQDEALPIRLLPGQTHNFHGTARYTGGGTAPSSFTVTVFADAVDHFCGPDKVNDSESINVNTLQSTDLQPRIDAPSRLSPTETGYVNVSARNTGTNDVDQTFYVNVTIRRCNGADCSAPIFRDSIPVNGLTAGNHTFVLQDYAIQCEQGWSSIYIEEWVDATDVVTETNENNNYDSATVGCAQENCVIRGTSELRTPGIYKFYASCFGGHQETDCSDMMGEYDFEWTYTPTSSTSFLEYRYNIPGYDYGANHENSTLEVIRIYSEGLFSVSARGRLSSYQSSYLECSKIIPVYANPCEEHI